VGGARFTSSVVDAVLVSVPEVPVTVRDSAYGEAAFVVFMVSVELPLPSIDDGLNPPLVIPAGKPYWLPTLKFTEPVNPDSGVTVTVKVVACFGSTWAAEGLTAIEKSGVDGTTVIWTVGGFGSLLPKLSITFNDATYVPGVSKVTLPGFCSVDFPGDPPGKTQEYWDEVEVVAKLTELPATMVTFDPGDVIVAVGGVEEYGDSWMNCAFDGTPVLSSRKSI
jgi:hypothetical protein